MKFKKPKSIDDQIEYLKSDKRVVFTDIPETVAKDILIRYGYINVITPYKYIFAKKEHGSVVKLNNKHCYEGNVDFNEYYEKYKEERALYPDLYRAISSFETTFNAVVSHNVINYFCIDSIDSFNKFIQTLKLNLLQSQEFSPKARKHMTDIIDSITCELNRYGSIYICMDRASLNTIIVIYKNCPVELKNTIFNRLLVIGNTIGYTDIKTFDDFLTRIVPIRNYVYHNNSLEILYRYYSIENNCLRNDTDKRKYKNIVKRLAPTKKTTS